MQLKDNFISTFLIAQKYKQKHKHPEWNRNTYKHGNRVGLQVLHVTNVINSLPLKRVYISNVLHGKVNYVVKEETLLASNSERERERERERENEG